MKPQTDHNIRQYTCDPQLEVRGIDAFSMIDNIRTADYYPLLKKYKLTAVDPDAWYPLAVIFDLFNDIVAEAGGDTQYFVAMGMQVAKQTEFPPHMEGDLSLRTVIEGWQDLYAYNHRGAELPPIEVYSEGVQQYGVYLRPDHLYPFDLVYGQAFGFCKRFLDPTSDFVLVYDTHHSPYHDPSEGVILHLGWE